MKIVNVTDNNIFTYNDVKFLFTHAYHLAQSDWDGDINVAISQCISELQANQQQKKPTVNSVVKAVAGVFDLSPYVLQDVVNGRHRYKIRGRFLALYFLYLYTDIKLEDICVYFGYEHHSSVLHAAKTISNDLEYDKTTRFHVDKIKSIILYQGYTLSVRKSISSTTKLKAIA